MIAYLEALAADIAEAVAEAHYADDTLCEPARVTVVGAVEPAMQAGDCDPAIWVWLDRIEDEAALTEGCAVNTLVSVSYRIDVCYQTTAEDETDEIHLTAAECLYGLMNAVWCHLVELKDTGELMGLGTCDHVTMLPLQTGVRQGGTVSATGGISFQYDCL